MGTLFREDKQMYEYRVKVLRVVDGDTVDVDIDLGFGVALANERVRIMGIDTPECRTSDDIEKQFGLLAKQRVEQLLPVGSHHVLHSHDFKGKFGRILGDIEVLPSNLKLTEILLSEHLAVAYNGQSKDDIEAAHLQNREILVEQGAVKLMEDK